MMSLDRILARGSALLLCAMVFSTTTVQGLADYKTRFTFRRSVELPGGRMLQPGTYVFRVVKSSVHRHIVEVLDAGEMTLFATILAVEPSEAVIVVGETPASIPQPIRYWYRSERTGPMGYEFVYPADQATRIADTSSLRVLTMDANMNDRVAMMRAPMRWVNPKDAATEQRDNVRPHVRSASSAALTRLQQTPESFTLIGLTVLGVALVGLRSHRRTGPRPLERPLEQLGAIERL
jgi:hypothetical protein